MKLSAFFLCLTIALLSMVNAGCHKSSLNESPVANAGEDINLEIPVNYAKLSGSMHDPNGERPQFVWFKISGPETYSLEGNQLSPLVSSMGEGDYEYVLRAINSKGLYSQDTVKVTVSSKLRKYILTNLKADNSGSIVADIPEQVKNDLKWVFIKSNGKCDEAAILSTDYDWFSPEFRYWLLPDNKIGITWECDQVIIYY